MASQQPSFRLSEITTIPKQQNIITPASAQNTAQAKNAHAPTADLTHVYKEKQAHLDLSFEQKKKELSETLKIHDPSQEDHLSRILELFKNEFLSNPMWEPSRGEKEVLTKELLSLENTNSNPFTTPTLAFLPLAYQKNLTEKTVGDWLNEVTPLLQEMGKNNQNLRARH